MKSVAEELGLPADADEAAILAAVKKLKGDLGSANKKDAETQADIIMNREGSRIPESARPYWKEQLIKNREETLKLIQESFPTNPKRGGEGAIFNRDTAKQPGTVEGREGDAAEPTEADNKKAAAIRNRAHEISRRDGVPFGVAFSRAAGELG